jgi:hypothetical protein
LIHKAKKVDDEIIEAIKHRDSKQGRNGQHIRVSTSHTSEYWSSLSLRTFIETVREERL